jgi:dTDP-4-dehydrorhamnose reductase
VRETRPDRIIHCAAATDVDGCQRQPAEAFRLNRDMAGAMAAAAERHGASLVHISTDNVFAGERADYGEDDEPHPINTYGQSKLDGERAVLRAAPQALIVRTNIYGWNAAAKESLAEWFLSRCEAGISSPGWTDVWSTPILVNDLAQILLRLMAAGCAGVFHVGGGTCLTKLEFGRRVAAMFGHDPELVRPSTIGEAALAAPRAARLCLRGAKAEAVLGRPLPTVDEGLRRFQTMRADGALRRLKGLLASAGNGRLAPGEETAG